MYIIIIITQDRLTVLRENKAGLQNCTLFQILSSEYYSVRVHVCVCVCACAHVFQKKGIYNCTYANDFQDCTDAGACWRLFLKSQELFLKSQELS